MNIYPFIHPVAITLRIAADASFDNFYDFYDVYSDSVVNWRWDIRFLWPAHLKNLSNSFRQSGCISSNSASCKYRLLLLATIYPIVYFIVFNMTLCGVCTACICFSPDASGALFVRKLRPLRLVSPTQPRVFLQLPSTPRALKQQDVFSLSQYTYYKLEPVSASSIGAWKHQPSRHDTVFLALELTLFLSMGCIKPNQALWCVLSRFLHAMRLRKLNTTNPEGAPQCHVCL